MRFYHIKNLQSTKTRTSRSRRKNCFITLRIYKVLKHVDNDHNDSVCFITLRIYKVLKLNAFIIQPPISFITLRIYKVLKPQQRLYALIHS